MPTSPPTGRCVPPLKMHLARGLSLLAGTGGLLLATTLPLHADIVVRFIESAPKDRFVIEQAGGCESGPLDVVIDLAPAGLIFDTTATGAGVEVFQPFEVAEGGDALEEAVAPTDGDQAVTLRLASLTDGGRFTFTVDVDDTNEASALGQIRVAGSEIAGAVLKVNGAEAPFADDATARVALSCS